MFGQYNPGSPRLDKYPHSKPPAEPVKRRCHRCQGTGRAACPICNGRGEVVTGTDVNGNPLFGQCTGCFGLKTARCPVCSGEGYV